METMVRTQVQLTRSLAEALRRTAAEQGVSQADIIRKSLEMYLRRTRGLSEEDIDRRALALIGAFQGPSDLSERHDDYAVEAYQQ
jgi:metal-responsive CopG/Arc/MetJ family transcriptional regulator